MKKTVKIVSIVILIALLDQIPQVFWWCRFPTSVAVIEKSLQQSGYSESETEEAIVKQLETLPFKARIMPYTRISIWSLLAIASLALLFSKWWAFFLFYSAAAGNIFTALSFVPVLSWLTGWVLVPWGLVFVQLCNLVVMSIIIKCHIQQSKMGYV
jgi:hypothetical protein